MSKHFTLPSGDVLHAAGGLIVLAAALATFNGCESTGTTTSVSGSVYYGTGFYDPWYHGDYYYPPAVVAPPPMRPPPPPRPTHPIAPAPRPRPMPRGR